MPLRKSVRYGATYVNRYLGVNRSIRTKVKMKFGWYLVAKVRPIGLRVFIIVFAIVFSPVKPGEVIFWFRMYKVYLTWIRTRS